MNATPVRSIQTIVLVLFVLGLIALALGGYLTPVSRFVLNPIISAQSWLARRVQTIQNYINQPQDLAILREQNLELEQEVALLQRQIIELQQQIAETRILSALVDFARVHPENRYVSASVIGRDISPFVQYAIIDRGSDNGLRRGMPVVTVQGLVGQISAVTAGAARIQLLTDAKSKLNVRIEPSRDQAILVGSVTGEISLENIDPDAKIKVGDLVLTSGLGGDYPANILVGQVTGVRSIETEPLQHASIRPVVDFNNLEIVLVITNFRPEETKPLEPTPIAP